ncbi:MAG TPA: hypothetical protein VEW69_13290, partial [Alphaproteobacteria bacterium]|nr:hypothetical protein [Alphaproteobacteria bacterium]
TLPQKGGGGGVRIAFVKVNDRQYMEILGLRGIVWVKNADFEPGTRLLTAPAKGPTAIETPREWHDT